MKVRSVVFVFSNVDFGWLKRSAEGVAWFGENEPNDKRSHWGMSMDTEW